MGEEEKEKREKEGVRKGGDEERERVGKREVGSGEGRR